MQRPTLKLIWIALTLAALIGLTLASATENQTTPPVFISPSWNVDMGIELPIGPSAWEAATDHLVPRYHSPYDSMPSAPVVNPAEWEPMSGVLIRYPLGLPYAVIAEFSENDEVKTIVSSTSQQNTVQGYYQSNGVNVNNCTWLIAPTNSYWTRDYGPWYIFNGWGVQGIVDQIYNRPQRPLDNLIPGVLGNAMNIPVYALNLYHTGGNYMSDGMGVGMSTNMVYSENSSMTPSQVDLMMYQWLGIDYMVVPDQSSSGIHHIDCFAKLLNPGTILVKHVTPPNPAVEANVALWQSTISSYRRPYECVRVENNSSTAYTNSLIVNDKVYLPIWNNGSLDQQAIAVYQNAMPGYQILGFTGSWLSDDAIHCRGMGMTDRYMLRIVHVPLFDQVNTGMGYPVIAKVHAYSNQPLLPGQPQVRWRLQSGTWASVPMTQTVGDTFIGYLPEQAANSTIQYYVHAEDDSGKIENHPYIGAPGAHSFKVLPANGVNLTMTPVNPPIVIPANGGSFTFNVSIANTMSGAEEFWAWTRIRMPNGTMSAPTLGPLYLNLPAGVSLARTRNQNIPGTYPPGSYAYIGYLGDYTVSVIDSAYFSFTKSVVSDGGPFVLDLSNTGEEINLTANHILQPETIALEQNYPNPFNPSTTIRYTLTMAAKVNLAVFDVQGRLVATLVDGSRNAGIQEVTWDASGMASGLYFCHLTVGNSTQVMKMMLVK
jgi:agmatine/peptidylarginine deiminase